MGPDQAAGSGAGAPGDIYSLGLVALGCLTGVRQFPGFPIESMVARTLRRPHIPDIVDRRRARLIGAQPSADEPSPAASSASGSSSAARVTSSAVPW
jgi:hypothetical protein